MKNLFFLALIAINLTVSSQSNFNFISSNKDDIRLLSDSIALNAKRTYSFYKEGFSQESLNHYILSYRNVADSLDKMNVFFRITMLGANDALEIKGTPEYHFYGVTGKFLDLYPFWKKFINPGSIDKDVAEKKEDIKVIGSIRFTLKEYNGYWKINTLELK